jgi:hypothetical protein
LPAALNVRFGSKADIGAGVADVRFTLKSGHFLRQLACPLSAKSGHCIDRSESYRFSLTSADAFYFGAGSTSLIGEPITIAYGRAPERKQEMKALHLADPVHVEGVSDPLGETL